MDQFTLAQALAFNKSGVWVNWSPDHIVAFQLFQERLCLPFARLHEAVEIVLGRPVYTHEFAYPEALRAEYLKVRPAPTIEQIIDLIPEEKRIIIGI